jgi:hypothetical protein
MIDFHVWSESLLEEWQTVRSARPRTDLTSSVDLECLKSQIDDWATLLRRYRLDTSDMIGLAETCYQFENRLKKYKEKVVIELLHHGTLQ